MKTIEKFWLTIFFLVIVTLISYPIIIPNDVLIKEDTEYLYYKEYSWWGLDSCYYKLDFKQNHPQTFNTSNVDDIVTHIQQNWDK